MPLAKQSNPADDWARSYIFDTAKQVRALCKDQKVARVNDLEDKDIARLGLQADSWWWVKTTDDYRARAIRHIRIQAGQRMPVARLCFNAHDAVWAEDRIYIISRICEETRIRRELMRRCTADYPIRTNVYGSLLHFFGLKMARGHFIYEPIDDTLWTAGTHNLLLNRAWVSAQVNKWNANLAARGQRKTGWVGLSFAMGFRREATRALAREYSHTKDLYYMYDRDLLGSFFAVTGTQPDSPFWLERYGADRPLPPE